MFCISDQKWMKKHSPFCQNQPLWRDTLAEVSSNHHTALKKKTANTVMATPQKLSVGCTLGTRKQRENQGTNSLRKQTHSRTLPAQSFFFKVRLVFLNNNHTHAHTHTHTHTHTTHTHTPSQYSDRAGYAEFLLVSVVNFRVLEKDFTT